MPKKYYGEVLGKFFRNLLFVLLVAVFILCSLLLIFMVGNGIYLFFGKTTLITVTILLVTVPPIWATLYYKARENFRKDAIRVRQERFNEQHGTAFNIDIRYMLPEDIIDQASTICGIDPEYNLEITFSNKHALRVAYFEKKFAESIFKRAGVKFEWEEAYV